MELVYLVITGLSIIASILAWSAKLKWSKEYRLAKEAELAALKQQLNTLKEKNDLIKEFSSDKIMTLYKSTKEGFEILFDNIEKEKESLRVKIKELESVKAKLIEYNKNSIKLPDFTYLIDMSSQIEKSHTKFIESYSMQMRSISNSLEKFKAVDSIIDDDK